VDALSRKSGMAAAARLGASAVSVRAGARELVRALSAEFNAGEVIAVLGRNGSGKTLTLHTLAGLREPAAGLIALDGVAMPQLRRRALALRLGLLPQDLEDAIVTLSGGEQRRVAVAALLAQQPAVFLLDEPTNHLDPHHQLAVLTLFRALADSGSTVITTLHDPTLAARFADRVLLLFGDGRWSLGAVGTTLTAASLSELYATPMIELGQDGRRVFVTA